MVQIKSDSKSIETTLARMVEIIRESGGIIHDQLVIRVESGQISLETPFDVNNHEPLIAVPHTLLLPREESVLRLDGDDIVIDSFSSDAPPERRELVALNMDLFNQCGKIAWQRKCTPWLYYFDAPGLYDRIVEGRQPRGGFDFMKGVDQENKDDLLLKTFLHTRYVEHFSDKEASGKVMLMPLLDLANHHPLARHLENHVLESGVSSLALFSSNPVEGSSECFKNYGMLDCHDIFLYYGYVEPATRFVRALPQKIELNNLGTLEILNERGSLPKDHVVPEGLEDLVEQGYYPGIVVNKKDGYAAAAHLMIPQDDVPDSLRRLLGRMIGGLAENSSLSIIEIKQLFFEAERTIVNATLEHYEWLGPFLENYDSLPEQESFIEMGQRMAKVQIEKIKKYPFYSRINS